MQADRPRLPKRSLTAVNDANFFQAETVGVILQSPSGWLTDKLTCRRTLFTVVALITAALAVGGAEKALPDAAVAGTEVA